MLWPLNWEDVYLQAHPTDTSSESKFFCLAATSSQWKFRGKMTLGTKAALAFLQPSNNSFLRATQALETHLIVNWGYSREYRSTTKPPRTLVFYIFWNAELRNLKQNNTTY